MNEFTSSFWSGWVTVIVAVSLVWLAVLLYTVYFGKRGKSAATDTVWDETLTEGEHPPPVWWFVFLFAAMTFTVVYLVLYPGLGGNEGALKWTSAGHLAASKDRYDREFSALFEQWEQTPAADLGTDGLAMEAAANIYLSNCSSCHGPDARGQANLFPDLTDDEWIWGGGEEQLRATLLQGRRAAMPPWGAALKEEGVDNVARYVLALSKGEGDNPEHADGKASYGQVCVACHGVSGEGNPLLGAPPLNNDIWLYGGDLETVKDIIANGRNGHMPAQQGRLTPVQVHLLVGWLLNGAHI